MDDNKKIMTVLLLILTYSLYVAIFIVSSFILLPLIALVNGIYFSKILISVYYILLSFGVGYLSKHFLTKSYTTEKSYLSASIIGSCIIALIMGFSAGVAKVFGELTSSFEKLGPTAGGVGGINETITVVANPHILFLLSIFAFNLIYWKNITDKKLYAWYLLPIAFYFVLIILISSILGPVQNIV